MCDRSGESMENRGKPGMAMSYMYYHGEIEKYYHAVKSIVLLTWQNTITVKSYRPFDPPRSCSPVQSRVHKRWNITR